MPLYEYACGTCGHRFERIQKFSDPPLTECPQCGGAVEKLVSSPAIQFKGTGWYITDYAKSGKPEKSQTDKKDGTTGSGGVEKSGESTSGPKSGSGSAATPESPTAEKASPTEKATPAKAPTPGK